jgi:hypothetical protein
LSYAVRIKGASAEVAVVEKPLLGNALIGQACATASWTRRDIVILIFMFSITSMFSLFHNVQKAHFLLRGQV